MAQDVRLSESMEQTSDLTAQEFDNAKIEAVENDYNMGNFKQEYNDMVEMNAGIDDTFNLQTREAEIDAEIETLEFDAENTSNAANIDADDLAAFDENIRIADDLIARSDESFDTATNAAASCIMRNTK
jgi:outer membrane PBP1 activator LpoA protein